MWRIVVWTLAGIEALIGLATFLAAKKLGVNPFIGVRTGYSTLDTTTWLKSNTFTCILFVAHALLSVVLAEADVRIGYMLLFIGLPVVVVASIEYSRFIAEHRQVSVEDVEEPAEPIKPPSLASKVAIATLASILVLFAAATLPSMPWELQGPLWSFVLASLATSYYSIRRPEVYHASFIDKRLADKLVVVIPLIMDIAAICSIAGILYMPYAFTAEALIVSALLYYMLASVKS